ncbi:hypothetical protein C6P92_08660 [Burkholderia multivorans]|uniref:hypothetical protein n=1 Tax=Burkholderia multivorans TaxID=87883 RepID=UPI000D3FC734|nr:hypothetical protein [Burkholderia multivorans]PRE24371.1 hypothetical protein C6P92_08660 [Burkholderia multivorans]
MSDGVNQHMLKLMRQSAHGRLDASRTLRSTFGEDSDSAYLLELLAFEILLKCLVYMNGQRPSRKQHMYLDLFNLLPEQVRSELLAGAATRVAPSRLPDQSPHLLETWGKNFIRLRYPYEAYEDLTEAQYAEIGEDWIALGAPEESATFVYYSNELFGMVEALLNMTASLENT